MSNCSTCKYKRNVPGDAHLSCEYPLLDKKNATVISMMSMTNPQAFNNTLLELFGFQASMHGIQSGWFMFPSNFDPNWIEGNCNKHSDIVGEAVEYQLTLNECLDAHKALFIAIQKKEKDEAEHQYIFDAYDAAVSNAKGMADASEEEKTKARDKMVIDLKAALALLKAHSS